MFLPIFLHVGVSTKCELNQIYGSNTNLVPCLASGATLTIQFLKSPLKQFRSSYETLQFFEPNIGLHQPLVIVSLMSPRRSRRSKHWLQNVFFDPYAVSKTKIRFSRTLPAPVRWVMFIDMAQGFHAGRRAAGDDRRVF